MLAADIIKTTLKGQRIKGRKGEIDEDTQALLQHPVRIGERKSALRLRARYCRGIRQAPVCVNGWPGQ